LLSWIAGSCLFCFLMWLHSCILSQMAWGRGVCFVFIFPLGLLCLSACRMSPAGILLAMWMLMGAGVSWSAWSISSE
jgi:hypothetical protein